MSGFNVFWTCVFFTGIILIVLNQSLHCQPQTEYRYLPRDLDAYLRENDDVGASTQNMFEDDAWLDWQGRAPVAVAPGPSLTQVPRPAN